MATMAEITAAITQIDTKKQNLHKSFQHLQSRLPSSFTLPLNWSDLDSYFTSLHSSLQSKFNLLQTLPPPSDPSTPPARPELKSFCLDSDGLGLNRFIAQSTDQQSILSELPDAYRYAPDAPSMVLDATASFYGTGMRLFRSGCLIMLEALVYVKPDVTVEVKGKAMEMAVEWNRIRVSSHGAAKVKEQNALGFLLLVGAYGLVDRFRIDDVIDCLLVIAKKRHAIDLCRRIVPPSHVNDVIQKLIDKDMHVTAVNFSIELEKTVEFPPVGLLEERKLRSMMVIEETRGNVKDLHVCNARMMKEISTLKSIIECIEENNMQSEYPKDSVVELVSRLETEVENSKRTLVNGNGLGLRKQPVRATVLKSLQSKSKMSKKSRVSKKPNINNVRRQAAESAAAIKKLIQEFHSQKSDSSPDNVGDCRNSSRESGPTGSNVPYTSPIVSPHRLTQADTCYNYYAPQLQPPSDYNSNGWISD